MDDCIFCKIVKSDIPSAKIYEDNDFFAFLDINPITKGHMLLVPKIHSTWMQETENKTVAALFILAKDFMKKMVERIPCDYVQILVEGKDVPHFHVHLIPRMYNDQVGVWTHQKYISEDEMQLYADKIKI